MQKYVNLDLDWSDGHKIIFMSFESPWHFSAV